jgi:DNA-binding NtrC family response regulator
MASVAMIPSGKRKTKLSLPMEGGQQSVIDRIAESDCPVLILGEHGAGKRFMAQQIHAQSNLSRYEFKEIRCGDASAETLQDALSTNGTIYLSEICELNLALQGLIVDEYFHSEQARASRLLCSSSRELLEEVKSWRMREDFYYLVSAVSLRIPPLRCRKSEILSIADELMTQFSKQFDRPKPVLCKEIIGHLMEHTWPDNLPELQTAIKTFVAIGDQAISLAAIKAATWGRSNGNRKHPLLKEATRASSIQIERQLITEVLALTGGNRKRAAAELGISYKALLNKLKQIEAENQFKFCNIGVA